MDYSHIAIKGWNNNAAREADGMSSLLNVTLMGKGKVQSEISLRELAGLV